MTDLRVQIADAVARARIEIEGQARRAGIRNFELRPHPPADDEMVRRFEAYHHVRLPPSYRAFVSLHDGYEGLAYFGDMLPLAATLPGGSKFDEVARWKRLCADYGSGEVLDGIVIASSRQQNQWLFIDPDRPRADGEFVLVDWLGDTSQELSSLLEYFEFVIMSCRTDLGSTKAPPRRQR